MSNHPIENHDSLSDSSTPEWQKAWTSELSRRLVEIKEGRVQLIDADEVHEELQAELQLTQK